MLAFAIVSTRPNTLNYIPTLCSRNSNFSKCSSYLWQKGFGRNLCMLKNKFLYKLTLENSTVQDNSQIYIYIRCKMKHKAMDTIITDANIHVIYIHNSLILTSAARKTLILHSLDTVPYIIVLHILRY